MTAPRELRSTIGVRTLDRGNKATSQTAASNTNQRSVTLALLLTFLSPLQKMAQQSGLRAGDWDSGVLDLAGRPNPNDGQTGFMTLTFRDGKVAPFCVYLNNDTPLSEHLLANTILLEDDEADADPRIASARTAFKQARGWFPIPRAIISPDRIAAVRSCFGEVDATGVEFAYNFLVHVSLGNPAIQYPPLVTDRMAVDMAEHMLGCWNYLESTYKGNDRAKSKQYVQDCEQFAMYMLERLNIHQENDWYVSYMVHFLVPVGHNFNKIDQARLPQALWPLSSEHTSMTEIDAAYRKYNDGLKQLLAALPAGERIQVPGGWLRRAQDE